MTKTTLLILLIFKFLIMQFYYDFKKMAVTNPLDGITNFFINPRMIDGFKQLKLDDCCYPDQLTLDDENLPILVFPLEALGLDKAIVTLDDNGRNGKIKTDGLTIYFNKEKKSHIIRVNTVLGSKPRKTKEGFEIRMADIVKSIVNEENIW